MDSSKDLTKELLRLMQDTGYPLIQQNGQRKYGPPPDWTGPPPPKGCEVFIGKLPREVFEDELVPIFSRVGKIYKMRLMMDFSGSNRGYAFVTYCTSREAYKATKELNNYEVRTGRRIGVVKSVDNCRLFVGNIPKDKSKEEVAEELSKRVPDIVDVILYKNAYDRRLNRGFAFVEFTSHRAAAMARRTLVPGGVKLWDQQVQVDWAEPEPDIDDERMSTVKVLYVRNFLIETLPTTIQAIFEAAGQGPIQRVKKMYDYAFVHFYERKAAELAMRRLQNAEIDGSNVEIRWAKPVVRELYHIQKLSKGNAKFNNNLDFAQTLLLYKQHLDKKEYAKSLKDEGIGSACADSLSDSAVYTSSNDFYPLASAKLEAMCKRYMWTPPVYKYHNYRDHMDAEYWVATVELPFVSLPLVHIPRKIGPLASSSFYSRSDAQNDAAESVLKFIKYIPTCSMSQPVYPSMMPTLQTCMGLPYHQQIYSGSATPPVPVSTNLHVPTVWANV